MYGNQTEPCIVHGGVDMARGVRIRFGKGIDVIPAIREKTYMVRKLTALFALVLSLGMAVMPAAAQDLTMDDASEFGLEGGYMRMYMADPASEATVAPDLLGVMVAGFNFDSADSAEAAFEDFSCGFAGGFMGADDAEDCAGLADAGFTVNDNLEINGDKAIEITGEANVGGPIPVTLLSIQSDNNLFMVITLGVAEEGASDAIGGYLADAEPVDTDVEFSDDGTSTGGFFDMLPQEGDAEIAGLAPQSDLNVFEDAASTPGA